MRIVYVATIAALMPLTAVAQTQPTAPAAEAPAAGSGVVTPLLITAGIVGAAVVADIVTEGALSGPLLRWTGLETAPAAAPAAAAPAIAPPAPVVVSAPLARPWWRFW